MGMARAQLFFRLAFAGLFIAVTLLALLPMQELPVTTGWDKSNHVLAFFVLLALLDAGWPARALWQKLLVLLVYGIAIEGAQGFIPGRFASGLDMLADAIGLALYLGLRPWWLRCLPVAQIGPGAP